MAFCARSSLLGVLLVLLLAPAATAQMSLQRVYVDALHGLDSNPGTSGQPWRSITHALGVTKDAAPTTKFEIYIRGRLSGGAVVVHNDVFETFPLEPVANQHLIWDETASDVFGNGAEVPVVLSGVDSSGQRNYTCLKFANISVTTSNSTFTGLTFVAFNTAVKIRADGSLDVSPSFTDCVFNQCDRGMDIIATVSGEAKPLVVRCKFLNEPPLAGGILSPQQTVYAHVFNQSIGTTGLPSPEASGTWRNCKFRSGPQPLALNAPPTVDYGFKNEAINEAGRADPSIEQCKFRGNCNSMSGSYRGMGFGIHSIAIEGQTDLAVTNSWVGDCGKDGIYIMARGQLTAEDRPYTGGEWFLPPGEAIQPTITATTAWDNGDRGVGGDFGHGITIRTKDFGAIDATVSACVKSDQPTGRYPVWGISQNYGDGIYVHSEAEYYLGATRLQAATVNVTNVDHCDIYQNGRDGLRQGCIYGSGHAGLEYSRIWQNNKSGMRNEVAAKDSSPEHDEVFQSAMCRTNFIFSEGAGQDQEYGVYSLQATAGILNEHLETKILHCTITNHEKYAWLLIDPDGLVESEGRYSIFFYSGHSTGRDLSQQAENYTTYSNAIPAPQYGHGNDPKLVDYAAGLLHLDPVPLSGNQYNIDFTGASPSEIPALDIDGENRYVDFDGYSNNNLDLGADEVPPPGG